MGIFSHIQGAKVDHKGGTEWRARSRFASFGSEYVLFHMIPRRQMGDSANVKNVFLGFFAVAKITEDVERGESHVVVVSPRHEFGDACKRAAKADSRVGLWSARGMTV